MKQLAQIVGNAQDMFKNRLEALELDGGLTKTRYVRYLSMQFHLTRGVQRHFFLVAAHPDFAHRRTFRKFVLNFGNEEELHYEIALKDLSSLGADPLPMPLDVALWWAYFDGIVDTRPFVRLGATAILENLSGRSQEVITRLFKAADYASPENMRFFTIHRHDYLPHGDQIMEALAAAKLDKAHVRDLEEGAETASVLYSRMAEWALAGK